MKPVLAGHCSIQQYIQKNSTTNLGQARYKKTRLRYSTGHLLIIRNRNPSSGWIHYLKKGAFYTLTSV